MRFLALPRSLRQLTMADDNAFSTTQTWVFGTYLIVLNLFLLYLLFKLWPGTVPFGPEDRVSLLWGGRMVLDLWVETRYLLIVAVAGALGSYIHLATSYADFLGNKKFVKSWFWWYLLRPFIGVALALVLYFVMRGGLIPAGANASNLSIYGVAAVSGMCGLFSRQATDKLRETFETLFQAKRPPDRADKLSQAEEEQYRAAVAAAAKL